MRARVVVAALSVALSLACSSNSSPSGAPRGSRQQDVIGESEITSRAGDAANALQVIQKLRPQMLRSRGLTSPHDPTGEASMPKVYVDNVAYGKLDELSNVSSDQIKEIRFINARDATTQWGTGHMGGVILVTTKK
jgi:hypothetical protein